MRGLFITGTDTGVGKTVVSAALAAHFPQARYWKPIQTGIEIDDDTAEVSRLAQADPVDAPSVRLRGAVSPHLAARRANLTIDLDRLTQWAADDDHSYIVEGAGGVLVPVNETETMEKLMLILALPVLVVARTTVGTINHTLLTLEALRARSLDIAGVVMSGNADDDNRMAIEHYGRVRVAPLPRFEPLTPRALQQWTPPQWLEDHLA